jgi:ferric-dicitrate binding protein FerR (iron transport regulator)
MENERLAYLLARKMAQESGPEEEKELEQLLQQYPYASYIREMLMQPWKDATHAHGEREVSTLLEHHMARLEQAESIAEAPARNTIVRRYVWRYAAIAASVAILISLWIIWKPAATPVVKQMAIEEPQVQKAPRKKIVLPDGSAVWLNAGSKLEYPEQFNKKERVVKLEGEGFFDIIKDADRPFMVKTAEFSVRVLGTSFDVRAYPQEDTAVAALIQGSIEVLLKGNEGQAIPLKPNEKLTIPVIRTTITAIKEKSEESTMPLIKAPLTTMRDSLVTETAWVQNKLAFKHMSLEQVARLMEQWYDADIRFKNNSKKSLYFSGVFEKEDLEQALNVLSLTTRSFRYSKDASGIIWIE